MSRLEPVSLMLVSLLRKREFEVVSLTIVLTTCRPANCVGAISANFDSKKTNSTTLSMVTSWMRTMADDVLLRTVLPSLCSVFFPLVDLLIPFSLPGTLISEIEVVPVCFRQHSVNKVGSYIFLFAVASHCGFLDTEMNNVIHVSNPCVRPIMEKPRFSVDLILLPSVPD